MNVEFGLTEEHAVLRDAARTFALGELAPGAKKRARDNRIPGWMFEKMAELGYIGMTASPKYGGGGMDMTAAGVVIEEFGRHDLAAPHVVITPTQFALLLESGTEEQRQRWIPPLCEGTAVYSIAVTEPGCGTDVSGIKTKAVRDGDHYVISGEKTPSTRAMQADGVFVFARTNEEPGAQGVSCIYVPLDAPGVTRTEMPYAGMIPLNCASLFFDSVRVPVGNRVGEEGKGLSMIMRRFDVLRVLLCLVALAQARPRWTRSRNTPRSGSPSDNLSPRMRRSRFVSPSTPRRSTPHVWPVTGRCGCVTRGCGTARSRPCASGFPRRSLSR